MSELKYKGETAAKYPEVQDWCERNFGQFGVEWSRLGRDPMSDVLSRLSGEPVNDTYFFATAEMLTLFTLRWA
jgi:hypothetical protein